MCAGSQYERVQLRTLNLPLQTAAVDDTVVEGPRGINLQKNSQAPVFLIITEKSTFSSILYQTSHI